MMMTKVSLLAAAVFVATIAMASHEAIQAQEQSVQDRSADQLFDKPLHKQILSVPSDPKEHGKGTLTCFYYPHLMIKEANYEDHKGAGLLSITYLRKAKGSPACQLDLAEDERRIQDWGGNFLGVKGGYVFLEGADGDGAKMPFAVYTGSGDRVFVDSGDLHSIELTGSTRDLGPWPENPLQLRYRRSYLAPCSMRADEKECWSTIQRVTGLTQATPPDCGPAYEAYEIEAAKINPSQATSMRNDPSYIEYDVEAMIDSASVIRVAPIGPAVKCYPAP